MRNIELPDLFLDDIPDQDMGKCKAVISVLNKGKTNDFGKEEFALILLTILTLVRKNCRILKITRVGSTKNYFVTKIFRRRKRPYHIKLTYVLSKIAIVLVVSEF